MITQDNADILLYIAIAVFVSGLLYTLWPWLLKAKNPFNTQKQGRGQYAPDKPPDSKIGKLLLSPFPRNFKTSLGNLLLNGEMILGEIAEADRIGATEDDENRLTGLVNEWIGITIDLLNKEREEDASYFLNNFGLAEPVTLKRVMVNRMTRLKTIFEKL